MNCKTVFKINVSCISDEEVFSIIDYIGIEPGITDSFLFFGLISRDTEEEHYTLHDQLNDTLCLLYDKANILVSLKNQYNIYYSIKLSICSQLPRLSQYTVAWMYQIQPSRESS